MTRQQYIASVALALDLQPSDSPPIEEIGSWDSSIAASTGVASPTLIEAYSDAAFALARWAVDPARRDRIVGCTPSGRAADPCIDQLLDTVGRRAFRGRLTREERASWHALAVEAAAELGDAWAGAEHLLAAVFQSPRFLYRFELPRSNAATSRPYEPNALASRLSYFVWGTGPDDALLDAAEAGALDEDDGYRAALARLLEDPRAEQGFRGFIRELFEVRRIHDVRRTSEEHGNFARDRAAIEESFLRTALAMEARDGLPGLFSSSVAVIDSSVAEYLGATVTSAEFAMVDVSPQRRAGLLTMPAFLATFANEHSTSATRRGLFVRRRILCTVVAPPPADIDTSLPADLAHRPTTARMRLSAHQEKGSICAGCHTVIDPPGLALEQYDQLGAFRTHEQGLPIDPTGDLDGERFDDAVGFSRALSAHPALLPCLAGRAYEMASGVPVTSLRPEFDQFAAPQWKDLVRTIATHQLFRNAWGDAP